MHTGGDRLVVIGQAALPPSRLTQALAQALREICERLLPPRRLRSNPRVIKRKMANWKLKRAEHRHPPRPQTPSITITKPTRTTPTRRESH